MVVGEVEGRLRKSILSGTGEVGVQILSKDILQDSRFTTAGTTIDKERKVATDAIEDVGDDIPLFR